MLAPGSYTDVVEAVNELMAGERPERFAPISQAYDDGERIVTTPPYTAYLKIAEGCSNGCAFCIIPKLRGRYRSRTMDSLLREAKELEKRGVKELIVIAQDITRYGMDLKDGSSLAGTSAGAVQAGLPLGPPPLPVPGGHHRRAHRRDRPGEEDRPLSGHPHPALQ